MDTIQIEIEEVAHALSLGLVIHGEEQWEEGSGIFRYFTLTTEEWSEYTGRNGLWDYYSSPDILKRMYPELREYI